MSMCGLSEAKGMNVNMNSIESVIPNKIRNIFFYLDQVLINPNQLEKKCVFFEHETEKRCFMEERNQNNIVINTLDLEVPSSENYIFYQQFFLNFIEHYIGNLSTNLTSLINETENVFYLKMYSNGNVIILKWKITENLMMFKKIQEYYNETRKMELAKQNIRNRRGDK